MLEEVGSYVMMESQYMRCQNPLRQSGLYLMEPQKNLNQTLLRKDHRISHTTYENETELMQMAIYEDFIVFSVRSGKRKIDIAFTASVV